MFQKKKEKRLLKRYEHRGKVNHKTVRDKIRYQKLHKYQFCVTKEKNKSAVMMVPSPNKISTSVSVSCIPVPKCFSASQNIAVVRESIITLKSYNSRKCRSIHGCWATQTYGTQAALSTKTAERPTLCGGCRSAPLWSAARPSAAPAQDSLQIYKWRMVPWRLHKMICSTYYREKCKVYINYCCTERIDSYYYCW